MSRRYTHVQELLPEIKAMLSEGRSQREIAEHLGLSDKNVVKDLLKRERRKERKIKAGRSGYAPPMNDSFLFLCLS